VTRAATLGLGLLLAVARPVAAETCPALFADGTMPVLVNPKLSARTETLCFDAFAVLHSSVTRTPLYSAEHLTRASVADARAVARNDAFHEEARLPPDGRAHLEDYVHSGFDRGHLAPAGDMPTLAAQAQSFSLANIVPQDRTLNRGVWSDIEEGVRRYATRHGSVFVVTGVIFSGGSVQQIGSGVLVPTQLFKAIFDPSTGEAGAYLVANGGGADWRPVSVEDLQALSGIDVFPSLPVAARSRAMVLPDPHAAGGEAHRKPRSETGWREWFERELVRAARKMLRDFLRSIF
jgi:endonuclease G